jgi:hypothetical protein
LKYLLILFSLSVCIYCSQIKQKKEDLSNQVNEIRNRLLSDQLLPGKIKKGYSDHTDSIYYSFTYPSLRIENNDTDTINTIIEINVNDSLEHLSFLEDHNTNYKNGIVYNYSVNKYGILDYASYQEPPEGDIRNQPDTLSIMMGPLGKTVIEIKDNYPDSINLPATIFKKADSKRKEMYYARLKATLDELDSLLFK